MKKILIFYACYGGGHLSAANALKQYIDSNYGKKYETILIDCMQYVNKPFNKFTTTAYKEMAKKFPWAWGEFYYHAKKGPIARISSASNKILARKLLDLLDEHSPDIIISTHPFSTQMICYLKKKKLINCLLATVLTDFAPHEQWLVGKDFCDLFFVSHSKMRQQLIESHGIPEEKIFATGIPLSHKFLNHYDKKEIKNRFGLDINKKLVLFFGGGEFGLGKERTISILKTFMENTQDHFQIIAIAGKNEKMKEHFQELVTKMNANEAVKVLGFTKQVPELMSISDLVVTKPGGLTSTESLASGLPMLLINPIPGQEEENAEFLEEAKVAIWLKKDDDYNSIITDLLSDTDKLHQMKINTKLLAKKNSTRDICETILDLAQGSNNNNNNNFNNH